jgi:hypothetical protein
VTAEQEDVLASAPAKVPGTKAVALFMHQIVGDDGKPGLSIELQLEGDGTGLADPRDPAHAIALFVQHNPVEILVQAAAWIMHVGKQSKKGGNGGAPATASVQPLFKPSEDIYVPMGPAIVDVTGEVIDSGTVLGDGSEQSAGL